VRLRTPRLELAVTGEADLAELYDIAMAGIHPPQEMPFGIPWTDGLGDPGRREEFFAYHLQARAAIGPARWHLLFCAREAGRPVGVQGMEADEFAAQRRVSTGSWLTASVQGRWPSSTSARGRPNPAPSTATSPRGGCPTSSATAR
jgi:RimJ/RimL family protein N-acetyltransferase